MAQPNTSTTVASDIEVATDSTNLLDHAVAPSLVSATTVSPHTSSNVEIAAQVQSVRNGFESGRTQALESRRTVLKQLRAMLVEHESDLTAALATDLGKSSTEAFLTEIGFTINEIDHVLKHLARWSKPRKVAVPLSMKPGSATVTPQPLGTVLIIAPWNYPLQLVLAPLVAALAAGNTAVIKPSEVAPATAAAITDLVPRYLPDDVVQVVTGGIPETTALLAEPWDHIFYTGNGTVGRVVMRAAAEHLTPVTLELGGKSPAIVTSSADVEVAARRIVWGKFINAGQTCVAPDYVLASATVHDELVAKMAKAVKDFYGANPQQSADFGRIVNETHHARLVALLKAGGFDSVAVGGEHDAADRYFAPTIVTGVEPTAAVMQEEIFGPILPVIAYDRLDEAIAFVNARPKPLALYVFGEHKPSVNEVLTATSSGGVTVNHTLFHLAVPDLPFGGVGQSGMGAYHGQAGFDVFSHAKPVLTRSTKLDSSVAYPPYGKIKEKLLRRFL